jgi:hypothetical protein
MSISLIKRCIMCGKPRVVSGVNTCSVTCQEKKILNSPKDYFSLPRHRDSLYRQLNQLKEYEAHTSRTNKGEFAWDEPNWIGGY